MNAGRTKILLLAGALLLFVLLFIAPKLPANSPEAEEKKPSGSTVSEKANVEIYLNMAVKTIEPAQKQKLDKLIAAKQFDSVSTFWNKRKRPDLASYYAEEIAKVGNKAQEWFNAGNRYYYSVQFTEDKTEVPVLYQSAIRCFKKGLSMEPQNVDAKIMLASCYVEGSENPMQGITMMREIEKTDSNNVKLQLSFAFFSVRSGQLDKAISRFNKVLRVDSNYIEAYLHLADAYAQLDGKDKSIEMLEKYAAKTPDVTSRLEVNKYIEQLKENKQ